MHVTYLDQDIQQERNVGRDTGCTDWFSVFPSIMPQTIPSYQRRYAICDAGIIVKTTTKTNSAVDLTSRCVLCDWSTATLTPSPGVTSKAPVSFVSSSDRHVLLLALPTSKRIFSDSSVGIETCYGLDGPGIGSGWGRDFSYPSTSGLRRTHPPVQWLSCLFPWGKKAWLWCWPLTLI